MKLQLIKIAKDTNFLLKKFINNQKSSKLIPAMKYGLFPGGKKIRSKILLDFGTFLSVDYKNINNDRCGSRMHTCILFNS